MPGAATVLIDWAQNNERRSMVAPYSMRASDVPLVSTPRTWKEVQRPDRLLRFGPGQVLDRLARIGDVFEPALSAVQSIGDQLLPSG